MTSPMRRLAALVLGLWACAALPAAAEGPSTPDLEDARALGALIWERNPEVLAARAEEGRALAERDRAGRLQNPSLDLGAGAIPLGSRVSTAPGQDNPPVGWTNGPNYGLGLTQAFDPWRQGLRRERADAGVRAARLQSRNLYAQRLSDLLGALVKIASAQLRLGLLIRQQGEVQALADVTAIIVREGQAPKLDAERALLEQGRIETAREGAQLDLAIAREDWSRLSVLPAPDLGEADAVRLLQRWGRLPERWPDPRAQLDRLPQHLLFKTQTDQASADLAIAERQWLPEVGVRGGYTHDTLNGSPAHAVALTLTGNLPLWQRGEADRLDARSQLAALDISREALERDALRREVELRRRSGTLAGMRDRLEHQRLVPARATVAKLDLALKARGLPLSDLIQVRRTVLDLEGERIDLLEQAANTLIDYRRLLNWDLPAPEGVTP